MNKKEEFVSELIKRTRDKKNEWAVASPTHVSSYVLHPDLIAQVFETAMESYEIFFVVQKQPEYRNDFKWYSDKLEKTIVILNNAGLVYAISNNEVAEKLLADLSAEIQKQTVNVFFDVFFEKKRALT
jgi:hypothetical protein